MTGEELARRSILGFGELAAAMGLGSAGATSVVRRPNLLGARIDAANGNPWFDAAVVPLGTVPPADDPGLPLCLWTVENAVPGRIEEPEIATPCMGVALDDPALKFGGPLEIEVPSLAVLGDLNERAYGDSGTFGPLVQALHDDRIRTHGLHDSQAFVCVAMTLEVGDDLSIQYVATEESHRRKGLASKLLLAVMAEARDRGMKSATLQASTEGLPVWERLGFRQVATLRGYLRPEVE
jgi:GNAT superfamily N-acetyltransferase